MSKDIARLSPAPLTDQEVDAFIAIVDREAVAERTRRHALPKTAERMNAIIQQYRAMGAWGLAGSFEKILREMV